MDRAMVRERKASAPSFTGGLAERIETVAIRPQIVRGPFSNYLNANECSILIDLVRSVSPRVMIEFGCNMGLTAKRVLENVHTLETYVGVDVFRDHVPTLACQLSEVPMEPGELAAGDDRFFVLVRPTLKLRASDLEPCDALFIDGDHSDEAVSYESELARDLVRPGGIIVWHDHNNPAVEVTQVLRRLHKRGWPIVAVENSWLAFMRIGDAA